MEIFWRIDMKNVLKKRVSVVLLVSALMTGCADLVVGVGTELFRSSIEGTETQKDLSLWASQKDKENAAWKTQQQELKPTGARW
jgi:hypothetical protein